MKRYEPRTPGTKRAMLKAVINNVAAKKPEEIEKNLMHVEELMKKYEVLGGEPLPEDLRVTVIIVHQGLERAPGVDHPRDEIQGGQGRDHELR